MSEHAGLVDEGQPDHFLCVPKWCTRRSYLYPRNENQLGCKHEICLLQHSRRNNQTALSGVGRECDRRSKNLQNILHLNFLRFAELDTNRFNLEITDSVDNQIGRANV